MNVEENSRSADEAVLGNINSMDLSFVASVVKFLKVALSHQWRIAARAPNRVSRKHTKNKYFLFVRSMDTNA